MTPDTTALRPADLLPLLTSKGLVSVEVPDSQATLAVAELSAVLNAPVAGDITAVRQLLDEGAPTVLWAPAAASFSEVQLRADVRQAQWAAGEDAQVVAVLADGAARQSLRWVATVVLEAALTGGEDAGWAVTVFKSRYTVERDGAARVGAADLAALDALTGQPARVQAAALRLARAGFSGSLVELIASAVAVTAD